MSKKAIRGNGKSAKSKIITWVCVILALVIVVGLTVVSFLGSNGTVNRSKIVLKSDHFEVDQSMLGYYTYLYYMNFYANWYAYMSAFGIDTSSPLSNQMQTENSTWLTYFANQALTSTKNMLIMAEAAASEGMTLSEEDKKEIEENLTLFKDSAKEAGGTMGNIIANTTGIIGVSENDIRKCLELSQYSVLKQNALKETYDLSNDALKAYFNDHKTDLATIDYLTYTVKADVSKLDQTADTYDDDLQALLAETKAKAEALANCTTKEAFMSWIANDQKDLSEDDLNTILASVEKTNVAYEAEDDISTWAFAANAGDHYVDETASGTYDVYVILKAPSPDETPSSASIYLLTFTDETKAAEAKATFDAGNKDKAAFEALAASLEITSYSREGITSSSSLDSAVSDWVFSWEAKAGDSNYLDLKDSTGKALVLVNEISERASWEVTCENGLVEELLEKDAEVLFAKYTIENNGFKY